MIELRSVNKYFNKGKKNEIHVINNTTLNLDKGLVAFLGNSGCGKTTLLNTIGGLDKIKKGSIYVNGQKISSKLSYKVDKIRNLNVGYIFQDYKLIDNMSVYDNVAIVLTIMGLKNKNEIKKRVEYVLDKVGMLRYKKRPASMLSGGERQRVGIARAIVKNPTVILADEPTGNLDSKNSLEIMKIIKAISKEKLVILVTHETQLAKFYASRIIELEDGKIVKDYVNDHTNDLDYDIENEIYLKDLKNHKKTENINIYSDNEEKIKLDIVIKNDDYYLVFLRKFIPEIKSICDFSIEENFLGLEQKHIKKLTSNFLLACNSLYKHSFLFHIWNERSIYVNKKDYSLLIAFSDFTSKGFDKKEHLNNNEYMSENIDPYAFTGECLYDYYSEMYSIASILFKLLIGRYPYEGSLMDGIPKCSDSGCINSWDIDKDNDFKYWVNQYVSHPIFIFDNCDDRNAIGRLAHEKICLQRWDSLTERVKNMFCSVFSEGNVLRTNNNLISYSPMEWFEEIQKFEFKLK